MLRKHAIIVIKNEKGEYLQYFEPNWQSYLFLNCKLENSEDISKISEVVLKMLGTECQDIIYKFNKIHTKFSVKDQIDKEYQHFFYLVTLKDAISEENKEFIKNNIQYKWFSLEELEHDLRIQEVNSDIVGFIREKGL